MWKMPIALGLASCCCWNHNWELICRHKMVLDNVHTPDMVGICLGQLSLNPSSLNWTRSSFATATQLVHKQDTPDKQAVPPDSSICTNPRHLGVSRFSGYLEEDTRHNFRLNYLLLKWKSFLHGYYFHHVNHYLR